MPIATNESFDRLLKAVDAMGNKATLAPSQSSVYGKFIQAFPLNKLGSLSADEYCVGKRGDTFCRWLERGLEPLLGRYMPGTSRGHVIYFKPDGSLYKNRKLSDLSDANAVEYVLKILKTIAGANLDEDIRWIDDDSQVYERAHVEPRVTMGHGRKLRVLAAYHPDDVIPISSSAHVGYFLAALGCPQSAIPREDEPMARMLKLREYLQLARQTQPELSTRGFMLALYDPAVGIAPVDDEEDEAGDDENGAYSAYLLTWNPEHFKLGGDGAINAGTEHRWTCHSKRPKVGDTVYLARLGVEPRGVIVKGTVTEPSHQAPHWKNPAKNARYIRFRVDELRLSAADGLLPMALLGMATPDQRWSPQSSGVGISSPVEQVLNQLWASGANKHSLRQVVEWLLSSAAARAGEVQDWVRRYKHTTTLVDAVRADPSRLDEAALDELWRVPGNGIAHVGAGTLSNKEFADNLTLLSGFTKKIVANPTAKTLMEIESEWAHAVAGKRLRMVNKAVIRRVFAAASPRQFTTMLREADCQKILSLFSHQFELAAPHSAGSDWVGINADLATCMSMAGVDPARPEANNTAVWQLFEHLSGPRGAADLPQDETAPTDDDVVAATSQAPLPPRNLILYGPPGTGKTYQTIEEAISILAPEMLEGEPDRASIKAKFDQFVSAGRIVFTTFHQSFSYEDFVEGLRADTDNNGQIKYSVADGVFKLLCTDGSPTIGSHTSEPNRHGTDGAGPFRPGEDINGYVVLRCTTDVLELKKPNGNDLPFGMKLLNELLGLVRDGRISVSDIKQKQVFDKVPDTKLEPHLVNGYNTILAPLVDRMLSTPTWSTDEVQNPTASGQPAKVLIIDEINRGNVARIFGELITLIEPSKRTGMSESLSVTLPYSKYRLGVPSNLHIIATMNTADRSLVGLDVALRRRFEFREMQPRPDLLDDLSVEGVPIGALLRVINERIEVLLDRDHRLGHAYFLCLRETPTLSQLARVFRTNILPLLLEYFFEDLERVRWVLNDHRKPAMLQFLSAPEAGVAKLFGSEVSLSNRPVRWAVNEQAFLVPAAYVAVLDASGSL
jgi:5-methylcytosine-specific restriction enzyme B